MDVRQARQIVAIWQQGTFGRAAQELGISQPTLSRSIARIEDQLGVTLFERSSRGVKPTVFAEYIVSKAKPEIDRMSTLTAEVKLMAKGEIGRLTVGIGAVVRELVMPRISEVIAEAYPRLRLRIEQNIVSVSVEKLANRTIDIAIVSSEVVSSELLAPLSDFTVTELFSDTLGFFVRPEHPILARTGRLSPIDLLDYPIASPSPTKALRDAFPADLSPEQQANLHAFNANDYGLIRHFMLKTDAIGHAPAMIFARGGGHPGVVRLDCGYERQHRCVAVVMQESWHSPVIRRFVAIAQQVSSQLQREAAGADDWP